MTYSKPMIDDQSKLCVASGFVCGNGLSSASDNVYLEDVLRANEEIHLYNKIMELSTDCEDDPPLIFGWQNVEAFVRAIQMAREEATVPGSVPLPANPFGLPATLTVRNFKEALLEYSRIEGAPARLDTTCLPCSLAQLCLVISRLTDLNTSPWIQRIMSVGVPNSLPIAFIYVPGLRSNTLDRAINLRHNSLWG